MFAFRDSLGPVDVAFTDRAGGVSAAPFDALNLAAVGRDDPRAVTENLRRVAGAFGAPGLALMHQVHGREVAAVRDAPATAPEAGTAGLPNVDALVTAEADVTLAVRVADCIPLLLTDTGSGAVAALHVGRPGLVAGVIAAGLAALADLAGPPDAAEPADPAEPANPAGSEVHAWIGPHICGACYEVPEQMRAEVARVVPAAWATTSWGTPAVDIGAGARSLLAEAGVVVHDVARCTLEHDDLYSFRRDGAGSGRFAGLIRRRG